MKETKDYKHFIAQHPMPWCWWCGRGFEHRPNNWGTPWNIDRAHILNNPRRNDRRAAILLCSWCHQIQHGEQIVLPGFATQRIAPTIANMIWLKKEFDRLYFDRKFLATCSIGLVPRACKPPKEALENYRSRRPWHPILKPK